jgi:hypothetical protein
MAPMNPVKNAYQVPNGVIAMKSRMRSGRMLNLGGCSWSANKAMW